MKKASYSDSALKEFNPNDANTLNGKFYKEFLYILGLEETSGNTKTIIESKTEGSLFKNTQNKLAQYNKACEFDDVLGLIIVWINRILFLKLLEGQIVRFNTDSALKFLTSDKVKDFDELEVLFFDVLTRVKSTRKHKEFDHIPYMNSSLFEMHPLEQCGITVSNLEDSLSMPYKSDTVLRDDNKKNRTGDVTTLKYLLDFLDAYDFGSDAGVETTSHDKIINAAVLGLIFEKLNGYKEGSFYTPSFITTYMARETIVKSVLQKFKDKHGIDATTIEELNASLIRQKISTEEIHTVIDTITICDPAVGSGHFLVSALNELIVIKQKLSLFSFRDLTISNIGDELFVTFGDDFFVYTKQSTETDTYKLQKALFDEKKRIIENQLFGVDINPNSVNICRLRLWIELLKNAYYHLPANGGEMETLPNIDINIKCGNSLVSRFALDDDGISKKEKQQVEEYKENVRKYKEAKDKSTKQDLEKKIDDLKKSFQKTLSSESPQIKELRKLLNGEDKSKNRDKGYIEQFGFFGLNEGLIVKFASIVNLALYQREGKSYDPSISGLFGDETKLSKAEKTNFEKKRKDLLAKIQEKYSRIKDVEENAIYGNAFEWRFEFPEVLDDEGNFVGFDVVIGNPPYIMEDSCREAFDGIRHRESYQGKTDLWHIFTEQGILIARRKGYVAYIAKNQWMQNQAASKMRGYMYKHSDIKQIIDFGSNLIFNEASQQTMLLLLQKEEVKEHEINYYRFEAGLSNDQISVIMNDTFRNSKIKNITKKITAEFGSDKNLSFSNFEPILEKIESFKNFEFNEKKDMIQGLIGGPDEAFTVRNQEVTNFNNNEKNYLKMLHTNTGKYYTNESDKYIFYISNKNFVPKNIDDFPNIKAKLEPYKNQLEQRRETLSEQKKWYHLWWERDETFFQAGDKLVWAKRTQGANFTYTDEAFYGTANLFFIKTNSVNLKYIAALLNSKLMYFYMHERLKHTGDLLQIDKNQFMKIPLYVPNEIDHFVALIDEIIKLKKENTNANITEQESRIDCMVYKLYDLTEDEIKMIDPEYDASRKCHNETSEQLEMLLEELCLCHQGQLIYI